MIVKHIIARIVGDTIVKIARGTFCEVYRSTSTPHRVFIVQKEGYTDKEVLMLASGDNPHLPMMQYVDSFDIGNVSYTVYETRYTEKVKKGSAAYTDFTKLRKVWNSKFVNLWFTVPANNHYQIVYNFIEYLRDNAIVSESIIDALYTLYSQALNFDSDMWLEFPIRNVAATEDGTLVLRDVLFFPAQLIAARMAKKNPQR